MNVEAELAAMKVELSNVNKRLDDQGALVESVHNLAISLERLTAAQQNTDVKVTNLSKDVEEIKSKPQKRWELVVTALITAAVSFLISGVLK